MRTWIKRSLIAVATTTLVLGGVAAYSHSEHQGHRWQVMSAQDAAGRKARLIELAGHKLDLDAAQKAQLGVLADRLREQRNAIVSAHADPRSELQALVAGPAFDRARAEALVLSMTDAVRAGGPTVINAMADFYDSLRPEQQAELREMLDKRHGGRDGHHGRRGHHDRS